MAKKKKGKSAPSIVPATRPDPPRAQERATELQPNRLEIFWEKYYKLVYAGVLAILVLVGGNHLLRQQRARQSRLKWAEIFRGSGLALSEPSWFSSPIQAIQAAESDRLSRLATRHAREPIAPWLEFLMARQVSFTEDPERFEERLKGLQARHPKAEISVSKVDYAFHSEPLPPIEALLAELEENRGARVEHAHLFTNPEPDPGLLATLETDRGPIKIRFYPKQAPHQVANFCQLASEGFFDGMKVHKISQGGDDWTPMFLEFGDPLTKDPEAKVEDWGLGGTDKTIPYQRSRLFHFKGAVTAIRDPGDRKTSRGHVRILGANHHQFDGLLVVFGQVVEGLDLVESIARDSEIRSSIGGVKQGIPIHPPTIQRVALEGDLSLVLATPDTQPTVQPETEPVTQPETEPGSPGPEPETQPASGGGGHAPED